MERLNHLGLTILDTKRDTVNLNEQLVAFFNKMSNEFRSLMLLLSDELVHDLRHKYSQRDIVMTCCNNSLELNNFKCCISKEL